MDIYKITTLLELQKHLIIETIQKAKVHFD